MADLEHRDFKGIWIPKEVWIDENLNFLEKCILMEIDSLDNGDGCYASNKYLAEFCQCSERKISEAISTLQSYFVISVEYLDGNKRIIHSELRVEKSARGVEKSARGGSRICDKEIIDEKSNKETVIENSIGTPKRFTKPTLQEVKEYCLERGNAVDPQKFFDYYESVGWKVGKNPMKNWKASVRYWESNQKKKDKPQSFTEMFS